MRNPIPLAQTLTFHKKKMEIAPQNNETTATVKPGVHEKNRKQSQSRHHVGIENTLLLPYRVGIFVRNEMKHVFFSVFSLDFSNPPPLSRTKKKKVGCRYFCVRLSSVKRYLVVSQLQMVGEEAPSAQKKMPRNCPLYPVA